MGKRCVVAGCSNTSKNGVSMHSFPVDLAIATKWTRFVKRKRDKWDGPTKHSVICSAHFTSDCFSATVGLMAEFGMSQRRELIPGSVPTIYLTGKRPRSPGLNDAFIWMSPAEVNTHKRPRVAAEKRVRDRVLSELLVTEHTQADENQQESMGLLPSDNDVPALNCENQEKEKVSAAVQCQTDSCSSSCSTSVQVQPKTREQGTQVNFKPYIRSFGTQCNIEQNKPDPVKACPPAHEADQATSLLKEEYDISDGEESDDEDDPSYHPSSDSDSYMSSFSSSVSSSSGLQQKKFIVSEKCLLKLFDICRSCGKKAVGQVSAISGTFVQVEAECYFCGHKFLWAGQEHVGSLPEGKLALSSAILFSGATPSKVLRIFDFMNIAHIHYSTFMAHQRQYLHPTVLSVWKNFQNDYLSLLHQQHGGIVNVGGDGRADTPGHSAKFGSYTMMNLDQGVVFDVQLVQSNEVKSSTHMEKEGLARAVEFLRSQDVRIKTIVSDRHIQINKWIRENLPDTDHFFDVWHIAKGLKKKLLVLSKERECELIGKWIKSISNHLYWCAASTPNGDPQLMEDKWVSLSNHLHNIHSGHGGKYPACIHKSLEGQRVKKQWLTPGSKLSVKVDDMIRKKTLLRDVRRMSPSYQTSEVEAYHTTINTFAPKMIGFSYHGMQSRICARIV